MDTKTWTINSIAHEIGAELYKAAEGDLTTPITGLAPLLLAKTGDLSFVTNPRFASEASRSSASALICREPLTGCPMPQLLHPRPQWAMARAAQLFYEPQHSFRGQSRQASVHATAEIHASATIYPFAYVGPKALIEQDCVLYPHTYIGESCRIGAGTVIYPGAVLMDHTVVGCRVIIHGGAVLGGDGFGFAPGPERIEKIPQIGRVVIEDEVEIGPLATIDRATFTETIVRRGAKLDSQVHVGHNADVGEMTMLCAQVGIGGSTKIGPRGIAAGQAGYAHGLNVGERVVLGPQAGLLQSESEAGEYFGIPAVPGPLWKRQMMALKKLPELLKQVKRLEDKIARIEAERS